MITWWPECVVTTVTDVAADDDDDAQKWAVVYSWDSYKQHGITKYDRQYPRFHFIKENSIFMKNCKSY